MTIQVTVCIIYVILAMFFLRRLGTGLQKSSTAAGTILAVLLGGALVLRLVLGSTATGYETDINTFKAWAGLADSMGLQNLYYSDIFLDYPPGYIYVLWLLEKVRQLMGLDASGAGFTLLIKLPSIFADVLCGWLLYRLTEKKAGETGALFLAGLYLFCPAVLINSTVWGQADSLCVLLLLAAMLLLRREGLLWVAAAGALYGVGLLMKPQMLLFAPVFLFFVLKRRDWKGLGLGLLSAFLMVFLLALPCTQNFDFPWLFQQYADTMGYYNYFTINAYNLYGLLGLNWFSMEEVPGWVSPVLTVVAAVRWTYPGCAAVCFLFAVFCRAFPQCILCIVPQQQLYRAQFSGNPLSLCHAPIALWLSALCPVPGVLERRGVNLGTVAGKRNWAC